MSAARIAYMNIFAEDIEALSGFYAKLLGLREIIGHRSPIYRCLDGNGIELGFNAPKAYELLGLSDRRPEGRSAPVRAYFTFEVETADIVNQAAVLAVASGGRIIKPPYATYYNAWQCVLEDPEGNVFRVNHRRGERTPFDELPEPVRLPIES